MLGSKQRVLGYEVDCITLDDAIQLCLATIRGDRRPKVIATLNAGTLVMSQEDEDLRRALQGSQMVLADGAPIFWIARALGARTATRVTGIDLMAELLRVADRERLRIFLLGARGEVLEALTSKIRLEYPGVVLAGARDGYFPRECAAEVAGEVREGRADVLFVAMPSPFKEVWSSDNLEALGTPIVLPVGGAFDVLAGFIRRSPRWMQTCGLEWLWRLLMDPGSKWERYLRTNPAFLWLVLRAGLRRLFTATRGPRARPADPSG